MKDSIRADPTRPIKRVYDAVVLERNVSVDNCPMYHTVRSQLARCRASVLPDVPHHINDVDIFDEWARTWNGKQFCSFQDNAWGILVFCTSKSCKMLQRCKIMYIDGTFRTAPEPYMQFVTIHGFYGDRVIPFVFCLLNGKQVGQYRQLLRHVKQKVRRETGHALRPRKVVCDFEASLIAAIETELPRSSVRGCYFHFCQSLFRKIQELGLAGPFRRHKRLRKCVKKLMALGYLPLAIVRQTFANFSTSRSTTAVCQRFPQLQPFMAYMNRNYVDQQAIFPPRMWNVFDRDADNQTNNYVESKFSNKYN